MADPSTAGDYRSFDSLIASATAVQRTSVRGAGALLEEYVKAEWERNATIFDSMVAKGVELTDEVRSVREQAGNLFRERTDLQQRVNVAAAEVAALTAERDRLRQERTATPAAPQLQQFFNTLVAGLRTAPDGRGRAIPEGPSFEVRARLKEHRIPIYKAEPDLEIIIKFLKEVEHHVRLGGGEGDSEDAKLIGLAWTHLDTLRAYPWFVSWVGAPPFNIPEAAFTTGGFLGCTWELFKTAFRNQFGAQHAIQKVRLQLRALKFNKFDVPAFHLRFLELCSLLDLQPSAPHTDGIFMDYHAKLPNDLQRTLDMSILSFNAIRQVFTLADAIQLVAQDAARGQGPSHVLPSQPTIDPDAMDLSVMRSELNATQRGNQSIRCFGCGGNGHIRADCPSSGGGNSGAAGRDRASQPWRRGGGVPGGAGRPGGGARGGMRGGAAKGGVSRGLYATDTTEEEDSGVVLEEEEPEEGAAISEEELLQWAREEEGKGM